ncbi:uncharacterized protein LOC102673251 [Apis dorsata]|uniref:uncharacterized protein LOC102673251 n=1 Tax=Apis dorsata TaxID=7462 RepID=UPI0003DF6A45|nr:uncharacterized protein LOC102673251 [Apis dorsata]
MFGRQIFLKPVDNQHDERRNDYIRQLSPSQGHGIPFTELISVPYLRNDGLMLDLNFIFIDDDHVQSNNLNNLYFQTNRGNISNRYLLEYIRQMKERYLFMERELTRARMLIPVISRNTNAVHQSAQTDINWNECSLTKYGHFLGTSSKNQYKKNPEQINVSSRRKHYTMKRNKENSIRKTLTESDWMKHRISSQNLQNDIYPIKEPDSNTFQPRSLTSNSTTVCSMHNIAVILPQDSIQLNDLSKHKQVESKINVDIHKAVDKLDSDESKIFGNSKKYFNPFETRKTSMEICQSFDKKHEPETSNYTDFDVKHEDCTQTKPAVNTPEFRPIMGSKFNNDISSDQSTSHCQQQNINSEEKCNRNYWNNYTKKLPYGRTRANDSSRQFTRIVQKQKKEMHKRIPTPRSNVHTAYTPMTQPSTWNSMLDPNGFTIQLLRLAVLLYAPALMPALNSLIARQSIQTTIPHFEGSNDLLTQIFTILNNQQCVPNLSYAPNPRMDENSRQFRESSTHNSSAQSNSENLTKQFQNDRIKTFDNNQFEKNSIAVNTSLEICSCNTIKQSPSQSYNKNILHDQEDEKLVYTWTSKKSSKSSETVVLEKPILKNEQNNKEKVSENQQENSEFFENWLIQKDPNVWDDPKSKSSNIWQQYVNQ